jgi:4-amino-4-deoxy-L-arabinose transferase-like glycosyltransferase
MKDMLFAVLGLVAAIIAVWQLATYLGQKTEPTSVVPLIIAIIAGIAAIGFGGFFLSTRINKSEDIHITQ